MFDQRRSRKCPRLGAGSSLHDQLTAERESGGNSEFEENLELGNDADADISHSSDNDETDSNAATSGAKKNNSKNFKLLGFCISESDDAESDSDEEELERLMCSNAEDQPGTSTSPSLPTIQEEINPFAIDFTVEVNNLSIE